MSTSGACGKDGVRRASREIPSEISPEKKTALTLYVLADAYFKGTMDRKTVTRRLHELVLQSEQTISEHDRGRIYHIDYGFELVEDGIWTTKRAQDCLEEFLCDIKKR